MIVQFVVEWEYVGFYAKHQPTYKWSFTKDITKAHAYKTEAMAVERAKGDRFGSGHNNRPWRVIKVDGNFTVIGDVTPFIPPTYTHLIKKASLEKDPPITLSSIRK